MKGEEFSTWLSGIARLNEDQRQAVLAALTTAEGGGSENRDADGGPEGQGFEGSRSAGRVGRNGP